MYRVKVGCQLSYATATATPAVFIVQPPPHTRHMVAREEFQVVTAAVTGDFVDHFGNRCQRVLFAPGENVIRYDALVTVTADLDPSRPLARQVPPQELPPALLRYTLPSRYAETDELLNFAWEHFGRFPAGWERAKAICDWVHKNVEYKLGSSFPDWSAADTILRRQGVCRDMAHVVVALCRAFNMPARYAVAYLPDIEVPEDGLPMDFHAYAEVWLEGGWQVFDPHDNVARKGRIFIASGLDAADAAFATIYGAARLTRFQVWADPVDEQGTKLHLALPRREAPGTTNVVPLPAAPPSTELRRVDSRAELAG
jgi:transglutaminase-like putative cysteine protease